MSQAAFLQQQQHRNGPHQPDCPCRGPGESTETYRLRLRNESTARMARVRGLKYNKYKDNGELTERRYGRVVYDTEPPGLSQSYAPQEFSTADIDDAVAKYGGGGRQEDKGYGVLLKKILGAGRFGIVALVDCTDDQGNITSCVLKLERRRHHVHGTLAREEKALTKFKGAKHILQILDHTQLVKSQRAVDYNLYSAGQVGHQPVPRPDLEEEDRKWGLDRFAHQPIRNFVFVEHASQGDLHMWLSKASRSGTRWPVRAIWLLFKSLVQGLVGMGYPPKDYYQVHYPEWDPNDPVDEQLPDEYPMSEHYPPEWTTHFDLEPSNVLASNNAGNDNMPIFKIADFGSAQFFNEVMTNPAYFTKELFWKCRFSGKGDYFTPEQFTKQWDYLDLQTHLADDNAPNPFLATDGTRPPVAGNYGMHSNVFQVGVIIWCAITLCAFKPLTATMYKFPHDREIVTWGGALQNARFDGIDDELRTVVQRCMAEDPLHRPSLGELMRIIEDRLGANDLEPEEAVAYWAKDFFSSPRTPGDDGHKRKLSGSGEQDDEARRYAPRQKTEAEPMIHSAFQEPKHTINVHDHPVNFQHGWLPSRSASGYPGASRGSVTTNGPPGFDPRLFETPCAPQQWQGIPAFGAQPTSYGLGDQPQMQQNQSAATFRPGGYFNVHAQFGESPFKPPQYQPAQHIQPIGHYPKRTEQRQHYQQQPEQVPQSQAQPEDRPWWDW